jgi:polar amino acid transport system substrate-binding protein
MNRTRTIGATGLLAAALLVSACGGGGGGGGGNATPGGEALSAKVSENKTLAKMVPSNIASDGVITVGTDSTYAPNEFLASDGKTVQGFDVDLFNAVAAKLGLKTKYVSAPFDNIIPSVQSGKYEIGVSSFTINPDRMKVVDMVSYFSAGTAWAAAKGNPTGITPDNACGKRVAVQRGTVQVDDVTARSQKCTAENKSAIAIDQFQGQDQATSAVVSGKDDAMLADSPVIAYAVKQTGDKLQPIGAIYDAAPYGYALKKGEGQFATAVSDAVNELIKDGTYAKLLDKWGVGKGAVSKAEVDPSSQ